MIKLFIILLLIPLTSQAAALPEASNVPGGIVKLPLGNSGKPRPKALFQDKPVLITELDGQWIALVGIPLSTKPGTHYITVKAETGTSSRQQFAVENKDYPEQRLTLKNKQMVNPNAANLARIKADRIPINKALATWSNQQQIDTDFITPVDGRLSSLFGLKRFFNDQPRNPHSGLDIAAPSGTPIKAPAPALVIETGNFYYNGNTVFLDHGQGLITGYFHMTEIKVKPGQRVYRGETLGTVGETGRVTGPHLHWNVYLNRTKVDPALFISQYIPILDARNKK